MSNKIPKFKEYNEMKKISGSKEKKKETTENLEELSVNDVLPSSTKQNVNILKGKQPAKVAPKQTNIPTTKKESPTDTSKLKPIKESKSTDKKKVEKIGKVAMFPKGTEASKAIRFLENVKIAKKAIWYIIVEKQDDELQMVKYNQTQGVDLSKFVNELKSYYANNKYKNNPKIVEAFNNIEIYGEDKYTAIRNIPKIKLGDKMMTTVIMEDLLKLLSK